MIKEQKKETQEEAKLRSDKFLKEHHFIEVISKEMCIVPKEYFPNKSGREIIKALFETHSMGSRHATRDGLTVSGSKEFMCAKVLNHPKEFKDIEEDYSDVSIGLNSSMMNEED